MSHSQFYCTGRVYLDLHGLIFETIISHYFTFLLDSISDVTMSLYHSNKVGE